MSAKMGEQSCSLRVVHLMGLWYTGVWVRPAPGVLEKKKQNKKTKQQKTKKQKQKKKKTKKKKKKHKKTKQNKKKKKTKKKTTTTKKTPNTRGFFRHLGRMYHVLPCQTDVECVQSMLWQAFGVLVA